MLQHGFTSAAVCLFRTLTSLFSPHMRGTNNNFVVSQPSFLQARIKVKHGAFIESEITNSGIPGTGI